MTKVAVVAVHGVADQKPAESARAIADLLNPSCGPFAETPIRIERKPAVVDPAPSEPGMQYMHAQLAGYEGDPAGSVYETVRLEGARKGDQVPVHVYEVYWADLSRAGSTSIRLFGELYQILLHFPSLGRNAIKAAMESATKGKALWGLTYFLQRNAVWFFTVTIPLLNLALLSLCLVALSSKVPDGTENYVAAGVIVLALAVGAILGLRNRPLPRFIWWILPFVCVGAGAAFWWWVHKSSTRGPKALMVEAAVIGCVVCILVTKAYTKMKNRAALAFGIVAALATSGIAAWHSVTQTELPTDGYLSALYTATLVGVPLQIAWVIALALAIVAAIAGLVAAVASDDRKEGLRVAWTARFSLAFPMAMFAVVTLALWLLITRFLGWAIEKPGFGDDMHELLLQNAGGFVVFAATLTLFILAAIWVAAPSVTYEIDNPENTEERSEAVGRWVTNGLYFIGGA